MKRRRRISGGFLVAAFRRPDFRVDATLAADPAVLGTTLRGTVEAKYLFGAPLSVRPVRWGLAREPVHERARGHPAALSRVVSTLSAISPAYGSGSPEASFEEKTEALDAAGRLDLSFADERPTKTSPSRFASRLTSKAPPVSTSPIAPRSSSTRRRSTS